MHCNDKIVIFWYPQLTPGQPKTFQHQVIHVYHLKHSRSITLWSMPDCRSGREAHALRNDTIVILWYPQLTLGQPKNFQHQVIDVYPLKHSGSITLWSMPDCRSGCEAHALRNDKIVIFWYPQLTPGQPKNFQHQFKKTSAYLGDFHNTTYTDTHREVSQATLDPYMTLCKTTQGLKTALATQHQPYIALTTHH
eukprot:jgi/Botrbrau1/7546/Bobra.0019s0031.2